MFIEGRIQTRSWEDKTSGDKKYRTEIVVENFQFGPGGMGQGGGGSRGDDTAPKGKGSDKEEDIAYPADEISPDDIPF